MIAIVSIKKLDLYIEFLFKQGFLNGVLVSVFGEGLATWLNMERNLLSLRYFS